MKKIVDYKMVRVWDNAELFSESVRDSIVAGWQPHGEMFVELIKDQGIYYVQAMVKYAEE